MKFAPVYHSILKNLKLACKHKPHYVQDIRFILSRPLVTMYSFSEEDSFPNARLKGVTHGFCEQKNPDSRQCLADPSRDAGKLEEPVWRASGGSSTYLDRPASECWALDPETLYDVCRADLRAALDGSCETNLSTRPKAERSVKKTTSGADSSAATPLPPEGLSAEAAREYLRQKQRAVVPHCDRREGTSSVPKNLNPIALKVLRYREILWVKARLEEVLGADADRRLGEALRVSAPLSDDDFIPDNALCSSGDRPSKGASVRTLVGRDCSNALSSLPSSVKDSKGSTLDAKLSQQDETNNTAVISAGAMGIIRECIAFRHKENLPLITAFLKDSDRIDADALRAAQYNTAELVQLVCDRLSWTCSSQNEDLKLTAWASPFDSEYVDRAYAGKGYFGRAHLIFSVRFRLEPLDHTAHIQLTNSYFTCLNIATNSLVETTGYLHPRDVMALLQERDFGKFTFQGSLAETQLPHGADSDKDASGSESKSSGNVKSSGLTSKKTETSSSEDAGDASNRSVEGEKVGKKTNAQEFELAFVNDDEGPVSMKGIFYYKVGTQDALASGPIKAITFGHLLLNS